MGAWRRTLPSVIAVLIITLTLSSCDTLRKKFTRQKKKGQTEDIGMVPVLEPEIYPTPENSSLQSYGHHYALVKVWYKDLWALLDEKNSDKRARYTLKQMYSHIDEMQKLLVPEKQAELAKLKGLLKYYDDALNNTRPLRNFSRIQSDLRAFHRQLRNQLSPSKAKKHLVIDAKTKAS